jgi:hypothetical protein
MYFARVTQDNVIFLYHTVQMQILIHVQTFTPINIHT